jgi:aerobic carbon-monoxide dehydrogenase small subunit
MKEIKIHCTVNGEKKEFMAHPMERLIDILRDHGLTGVKEGCGEGECGACAILLDGELVNACLIPVLQVQNCGIVTVEGLARKDTLHTIQNAFWEHGGAQCGFCTPGMLMAATYLLSRNPKPTREDIREGLAGNLCRCTGHAKIFDAVTVASKKGWKL